MRNLLLGTALMGLTGCTIIDEVQNLRDQVEGYTESFVIEGIFLGVEPFDEDADLASAGFDGAKVVGFVTDATQLSDLESAPFEGLVTTLISPSNGATALYEEGGGKYSLNSEEGLVYQDGEQATLSVNYGDESRTVAVYTPESPDISALEGVHSAATSMFVDLSGQGYVNAMLVVIEAESGEVTYSNEPADIQALYEMTHPNGIHFSDSMEVSEELVVEIPERAFRTEGVYAVGVAGIVTGTPEQMNGVNTALSTFIAGKFTFVKVCTDEYAILCEG